MSNLSLWDSCLVCPLDSAPLEHTQENHWRCTVCNFESGVADLKGKQVPDFRAIQYPQQKRIAFDIPVQPLNRDDVAKKWFRAVHAEFPHFQKQEIQRKFGTKLDKGMQFYSQQIRREFGPNIKILDLGCGSGGNRAYLHSLGFQHILTTDWKASGADLLADAHRLPLADATFHMIISTAVFEHLYNPFLAMSEISRLLVPGGCFIGSASFWEAWHGSSCFHLTPDGWNSLTQSAGMDIEDLWPGWGVMPAALSHVLVPGHLRTAGYGVQALIEKVYLMAKGEMAVRRLQLRASGSYAIFARKRAQSVSAA